MPIPTWYPKVGRHPDYDDARIILIDSNIILELTNRGSWDDELSWVMNCPASELRLKLNAQVYAELLGGISAAKGLPAAVAEQQRGFIDAYRISGKILRDDGAVPFFAAGRMTLYRQLDDALAATGNLSKGDRVIATDAIVNRIPLLTRDARMRDGLGRALNNGRVRAILKANPDLPRSLGAISLRD